MTSQPLDLLASTYSIALLIDADNFSSTYLPALLSQLTPLGALTVRRAFGDWSSEPLKHWVVPLQAHAIRPIQQSAPVKGKNATDMALVIDAMELLFTRRPQAFALASSDADFTPLVLRLREYGVDVYGFGEHKTPASFRQSCTRFFEMVAKEKSITVNPTPKAQAYPIDALRTAVEAQSNIEGWALLCAVGSDLGKAKQIIPKAYGSKNYSSLFKTTGAFETVKQADGRTYIRPKPR